MIQLRQRWQDFPLVVKSALALALPLVLLLALIGYALHLQQRISDADTRVRQALTIQNGIQALHTQTAEAATGVRGYLLTGREDFLQPYFNARNVLPETLATLKRTIRVPEVAAQLRVVIALWAKKEAHLEFLRTRGHSLAADELQTQLIESKEILDELRQAIITLSLRESEVVGAASQSARAQFQQALWGSIVAAILVLAGSMAAFFMLYSGVVGRMQRLVSNAENLVQGRPLETPPGGNDEIGQLATRLQNLSQQLASRADEAQAASKAKSQFLSRTSHELRTPLNAMLGYAQLIESDPHRPEHTSEARHILAAGRHLLALIDELLDLARHEAGEAPPVTALDTVTLAPLVQEVCTLLAPEAQRHGVIIAHIEVPASLAVTADPQRLKQIVLNLVSNAIKFNRPDGRVSIRSRLSQTHVLLDVIDTGLGLTPDQLARLFTPFERLDAEAAGIGGIGLGLALSRQLAVHMGGSLEAARQPGSGSVFTLSLPRSMQEHAHPARIAWVVGCNAPTQAVLSAVFARRPHWMLQTASAPPAKPDSPPHLVLLCPLLDSAMRGQWQIYARQHAIQLVWLDGSPSDEPATILHLPLPLDVRRLQNLLDSLEKHE